MRLNPGGISPLFNFAGTEPGANPLLIDLQLELLYLNNLIDSSDNAFIITSSGGPTFVDDRDGNPLSAIRFDGMNDLVNTDAALVALSDNTVGTWTEWIRPVTGVSASRMDVLSFGDTNANEFIRISVKDGLIFVALKDAATTEWAFDTDSIELADDTWLWLGWVQDGVRAKLYLAGAPELGITFTTELNTDKYFADTVGIDNGRIGAFNQNSGGDTQFFAGDIDGTRIWSRALSDDEMLAAFNLATT